MRLTVVNDNDDMNNSEVSIELFDFNGSSINKHQFLIDIGSNSSKELFSCEISSLLQKHSKNNVILRSNIIFEGKSLTSNDYFFVKPKELILPEQNYSVNLEKVDNDFIIAIKSTTFLYRFYILCSNDSGVFSDNYFNMLPGQKIEVIYSPSSDYENNQDFNPDFEFNSVQGLS